MVRSTLYLAHKYDLGCPTEAKCPDFEKKGFDACGPCPKHLTPVEPDAEPAALPWLRHILRLEAMVNVGCKFQPNDLSVRSWDGLIAMSQERGRMDRLIYQTKTETTKKEREMSTAQAAARRESKIAPPGQSLFGKPAGRGRR